MNYSSLRSSVFVTVAIASASTVFAAPVKVDVEAAMKVFKENECHKCHNPDKEKKGPSFKKIAAKYRGKPDAEQKLIKHMTTGPRIKLENGKEEDHKIIDTEDPIVLKNMAQWILSH